MRATLVLLISALLCTAAEKPNFSGTWKLNVSKSDFGKAPAPQSMISRIEHDGAVIKVHSEIVSGKTSYSTDYQWIADGRENVNTIRGNEIKANVIVNGAGLISNAKTAANGVSLAITDQWTLSDEGRVLTMNRTIVAPQGNAEQKFVYEK